MVVNVPQNLIEHQEINYDYDSEKPSTFINYLDMNNFHVWTMNKCLPYEELEWLENIGEFNVMSISECNFIGIFSIDMLSKYCRKITDKYQIKVGDVKKLIPNLGNKKKLCDLL